MPDVALVQQAGGRGERRPWGDRDRGRGHEFSRGRPERLGGPPAPGEAREQGGRAAWLVLLLAHEVGLGNDPEHAPVRIDHRPGPDPVYAVELDHTHEGRPRVAA